MSLNLREQGATRSPSVATVLSLVWPGLGHWYVGRPRAAVVFALPVMAAAIVLVAWLIEGPETIVVQLLSPSTALTVLGLVAILGLWRLLAMVDSSLTVDGARGLRRPASVTVLAAATLAVLLTHGVAASVAWSFYDAGSTIFIADADAERTPGPSPSTEVIQLPIATPVATPQTRQSRINVLLLGIDSSERRTHALTDTLLVVSVDPVSRQVAMISFPRDLARFPLWSGGTYAGKINSLMTAAENDRKRFPDGGLPTLTKELGFLLGVPIHYYAAINLDGFVSMIDRVGGVTIDNKTAINDPSYGGWNDGRIIGFHLSKGTHTLDGASALAYVRSRKGAGDNDFNRARRQQQLLVALADKLADPAALPMLPGLLEDATQTIATNFPADRLTEMLELGRGVEDDAIQKYVLGPPYATRPTTSGDYILVFDEERLAQLSIKLFGSESRYMATGTPAP